MVLETAAIRRPLLEGILHILFLLFLFLFLSLGGGEKREFAFRDVVWHLVEVGGGLIQT